MSPNVLIIFIFGLLAGWLIEWVIDWVYWRRPKKNNSAAKYTSKMRPSAPKTLDQTEIQSRVDTLVESNPALADVMASFVSRPDIIGKSPEVIATSVQSDLSGWFADVMDRSSGDYKRQANKWALILGMILAFTFNVDSIEIATRMWQEPTLRQVIVAQAQNVQGTEGQSSLDTSIDAVAELGIPVGWITVEPQEGQQCGWTPGQPTYPAIWTNGNCQILLNLPQMNDGWGWLTKFFGLLISGIAAAQGAPFWFDILNKVVNLRSSGKQPKTSQTGSASAE